MLNWADSGASVTVTTALTALSSGGRVRSVATLAAEVTCLNRPWVIIGILLAALSLGGCVSSHTTYIVERDGSGAYNRVVTVSPGAVAFYRAENLADDPDTPFATARIAVLNAMRRQGFPNTRLDATTDSSGLRLRLRVPVRDARHLTRVDAIMSEELGSLAPRHEFALQHLPAGWQASCHVSQTLPGGEGAIGILMTIDAIARADSFTYPDTEVHANSYGLAMLDYVCAGRSYAVDLQIPAPGGGDTTIHWQVPLRTMLLANTALSHTLTAPPVSLALPEATPVLTPAIAVPPDTNIAVAELALRRNRYDEALHAAREIHDNDRRDALLESIAERIMLNRRDNYDTVNLILNLLQSPGRRARLQAAITKRHKRDAAIAADEAANWRDELPSDTVLIAEATACLDSGWFSDALGASNIRDTFTRDALLLRAAKGLMACGAFAEAENILPRLGAEARATATELLRQFRAAASARDAMERQVSALYQRIIRDDAGEFAQLWRETGAVPDLERRAFLQANIAYRIAENDVYRGLALARSIIDTASAHRANTIGAIATLLLDTQRDTEGWTIEAEAVAAAEHVSNVAERCSLLGYAAQEYARFRRDIDARAIIRQALPLLASLPVTEDYQELDARRTAAGWLAEAGARLRDKSIINAALAIDDDETWRSQLRHRITLLQAPH